MKKIAIYGAGGFAREVAWLLSTVARRDSLTMIAFIEDGAIGKRDLMGHPILSWDAFVRSHPDASVSIGVGSPRIRRQLAAKCEAAGFSFATLVHHNVEMSPWITLAPGVTVCAGGILTIDVVLGQHVHVNMDCTIGHDARIGDFSTLSPGVHVSGNVHIGKEVFIGTGATIINGTPERPLVVEDRTVIAAGACVTGNTEGAALYAGVPATLKKRYDR
jgi:sugar O-acyltransferase (sialic acid O-acetyltransferase NeuD family)